MSVFHTLAEPCQSEEDIRKSRFRVLAAPVETAAQALDFFAAHHDASASHHCWAYLIGTQYRFNDDGEPTGTAGRPILQAIETQHLDHVAVLVIRWFGGIKLGAGGLVRAYGGCAANCLRQAARVEVIPMVALTCRCDFADHALMRMRLAQSGVTIVEEAFDAQGVVMHMRVARDAQAQCRQLVADLTRGRAQWLDSDKATT